MIYHTKLPNKKIEGFTLLELLVVISIIAILLGLLTASLTASQRKGRDSRRKSDIKAAQQGFEQYYLENSSYNCVAMMASTSIFPGDFPTDPKPGMSYTCTQPAAYGYCVCARTETMSGNADGTSCQNLHSSASDQEYFCLTSLYNPI